MNGAGRAHLSKYRLPTERPKKKKKRSEVVRPTETLGFAGTDRRDVQPVGDGRSEILRVRAPCLLIPGVCRG